MSGFNSLGFEIARTILQFKRLWFLWGSDFESWACLLIPLAIRTIGIRHDEPLSPSAAVTPMTLKREVSFGGKVFVTWKFLFFIFLLKTVLIILQCYLICKLYCSEKKIKHSFQDLKINTDHKLKRKLLNSLFEHNWPVKLIDSSEP